MEITLEQVERLREKADVSYGQAKQALEYSGGNLLDALIYLEEQGAIPRPQGAYYSTRNETPPPPPSQEELAPLGEKTDGTEKGKKKKFKGIGVKVVSGKTLFGTLRRWLIDNELEIWRREQPITAIPMLLLTVILIFFFWIALPLMLLGLFFGFRYQVTGPDLEDDALNGVMGSVADTAADVGRQVMDELRSQHEKSGGRKK